MNRERCQLHEIVEGELCKIIILLWGGGGGGGGGGDGGGVSLPQVCRTAAHIIQGCSTPWWKA